MEKLFISGSRSITALTDLSRRILGEVTANDCTILIGDADGADALVQEYLRSHAYSNVVVYYVGRRPRNNAGAWCTRKVESPAQYGTREFYTAKDIVMADDAEVGLVLWDGKSRGTLRNMIHLDGQKKPCVVYLSEPDEMQLVKATEDLHKVIRTWSH